MTENAAHACTCICAGIGQCKSTTSPGQQCRSLYLCECVSLREDFCMPVTPVQHRLVVLGEAASWLPFLRAREGARIPTADRNRIQLLFDYELGGIANDKPLKH